MASNTAGLKYSGYDFLIESLTACRAPVKLAEHSVEQIVRIAAGAPAQIVPAFRAGMLNPAPARKIAAAVSRFFLMNLWVMLKAPPERLRDRGRPSPHGVEPDLFVYGVLVGIITRDEAGFAGGRLSATPVTAFVDKPEVAGLLCGRTANPRWSRPSWPRCSSRRSGDHARLAVAG